MKEQVTRGDEEGSPTEDMAELLSEVRKFLSYYLYLSLQEGRNGVVVVVEPQRKSQSSVQVDAIFTYL